MCIKTRIVKLVWDDLSPVRVLLALAETIWAFNLWTFSDAMGRPTYAIMTNVASETTWSLLFTVAAIGQWFILLRGRYHARYSVVFALCNMLLWLTAVFCMYAANYPPAPGISGEAAMTFGAVWVFLRSGKACLDSQVDDGTR